MFEQTTEAAGLGQLPTLLRQLVANVTATPTLALAPTPTEMASGTAQTMTPMTIGATQATLVKKEFVEPKIIRIETNKYKYRCANCDVAPKVSKCAMDAHIHEVYTQKALLCGLCMLSTYNLDSLQRHVKEHIHAVK